jgi:DMSO/TMAO reductase YedYZ molybdopterin-dependent catalytic subunit
MSLRMPRRRLLSSLAAGAGGLVLGGCDRIHRSALMQDVFAGGASLTHRAQRLVVDRGALAQEFSAADNSPDLRMKVTRAVADPAWNALAAGGFADYRLRIDGMVARPLDLSLAQLRAMPVRTQITRHDCVEGWSAIGQWSGTPLALLLKAAGLSANARFIVFHCADDFGGTPYYESIDLIDAFHPQSILAWAMNGAPLAIGHGAPLRLRVERQLGYKQAKFVQRIEAVPTLAGIGRGQGGYWEDVAGYQWYAGI